MSNNTYLKPARYQVLALPADMSPSGRTLLKSLATASLERTFVSSHAANEFKDAQDLGEVLGFAYSQASLMKVLAGDKLQLLPHREWDRMEIAIPVPDHIDDDMAEHITGVVRCMGELALRSRHKPIQQHDPWLYLYADQTAANNFLYQSGLLLRTGLVRGAQENDPSTVIIRDLDEEAKGVLAIAHYEHLLTIILNIAVRSLVANDDRFPAFAQALSRACQDDKYLAEVKVPWSAEQHSRSLQH